MHTYVTCAIHHGIVPREDAVAIDWENGDPARRRHVCESCCSRLIPTPWRRGRAPRVATIEVWRERIASAKQDLAPVLAAVAQVMRVEPALILSPARTQHIAWARQVLMYVCREVKQWPWELIGAALGRNHSTVIYGCRLVQQRIEASPAFAHAIDQIRAISAAQQEIAA